MSNAPAAPERVEPHLYTDDYYLTNCHGFEDFVASQGRDVGERFRKALQFAGDLRGKRVLDVGSGRGELVIQSAMRGAEAYGIDYADAAVEIARTAIAGLDADVRARADVRRMDVKALEFDDATFDVVFLMDVVEHLYPAELGTALAELRRVLKAGGFIVMHTSPNTVFEHVIYPRYSRHVNEIALHLAERFKVRNDLFNKLMLPTGEEFPHDAYERAMHINEHSAAGLRQMFERHGFAVRRTEFWEPPRVKDYFKTRALNNWLFALDFLRFLRPISRYPPLSRWFCNHIWMRAEALPPAGARTER